MLVLCVMLLLLFAKIVNCFLRDFDNDGISPSQVYNKKKTGDKHLLSAEL